MIAGLLLLSFLVLGIVLASFFFPFLKKTPFFLPSAYFLGVFSSGTIIFGLTFLFLNKPDPLRPAMAVFGGLILLILLLAARKIKFSLFFSKSYLILFLAFFLFSFWFFSRTLAYQDGNLMVASNEYLDFGAHIPLIRSFSLGHNFPPELPFYSGKPIFYYFLFDFTTATLEKTGWSIATAYNVLSALNLASLFIFIFYFSQKVFRLKNGFLGFFSVLLFFLSPDLSFLYFFKKCDLGNFFLNLRNHNFYLNNGLTMNKFFGGFFTINVLTNQRHLLFGFGLFMVLVLVLFRIIQRPVRPKTIFFTGLILGLLPFWHNFIFLASVLILLTFLFFWRKVEIAKILLIAFFIALPQVWFIQSQTVNQIAFRPGFLIHEELSIFNWFKFWFFNLGLGLPLIIAGWFLVPVKAKKFITPFFILFLVPNLFTFAKEPFNDHKFFNLFFIFSGCLLAWILVCWWKKSKILTLFFLFLLTFSGFLDFLVVKNDVWVIFSDIKKDSYLTWIEKNSSSRDVFLTNLEIWDPTSFTGRRTFLGRPHYLWAYGANPSERIRLKETVLEGQNKDEIEMILKENKINFLSFKKDGSFFNRQFFDEKFVQVYQNENWVIYKTSMLK